MPDLSRFHSGKFFYVNKTERFFLLKRLQFVDLPVDCRPNEIHMRKVYVYSIISLFLMSHAEIMSQTVTSRTVQMKAIDKYNALNRKKKLSESNEQAYSEVKGSPYYYDDPMIADLVMNDGSVIEEVTLEIDLYGDEIIATDHKNEKIYIDQDYYKEFKINNGSSVDVFRKIHPDHPDKFVQVLYTDNSLLFLKMKDVEHIEMSQIEAGQRVYVNKFNRTTSYQIVRDSEVMKVSLKKKKFFKVFSKPEQQVMKDFAKAEKLKLDSESDFVQLLNYLSSMEQ